VTNLMYSSRALFSPVFI